MDPSIYRQSDPLGRPPEGGGPLEPFHRKASRPADPSISTLPGPMGSGPRASDPPDLSARRLRGRPNPSARGLLDPMEPDPKTEFHDAMIKQNSKSHNKKFHYGRIFLWIISQYFHKLSTYYPEKDFLILFHAVAVIVEVLQSARFEDGRVSHGFTPPSSKSKISKRRWMSITTWNCS